MGLWINVAVILDLCILIFFIIINPHHFPKITDENIVTYSEGSECPSSSSVISPTKCLTEMPFCNIQSKIWTLVTKLFSFAEKHNSPRRAPWEHANGRMRKAKLGNARQEAALLCVLSHTARPDEIYTYMYYCHLAKTIYTFLILPSSFCCLLLAPEACALDYRRSKSGLRYVISWLFLFSGEMIMLSDNSSDYYQ